MNFRAPQTFIRIDIANAPQKTLIQHECLYPCAPGPCLRHKFFSADFQRVGAERAQLFGERLCRKVGKPPETARIGVTELAIIVEPETCVSMFFAGMACGVGRDLSRHPEMNEQCGG